MLVVGRSWLDARDWTHVAERTWLDAHGWTLVVGCPACEHSTDEHYFVSGIVTRGATYSQAQWAIYSQAQWATASRQPWAAFSQARGSLPPGYTAQLPPAALGSIFPITVSNYPWPPRAASSPSTWATSSRPPWVASLATVDNCHIEQNPLRQERHNSGNSDDSG